MPGNAKEFAAYLRKQGRELPARVFMPRFRAIVFQVFTVAVQNTPVNTGRLRNGWHITLGEPSGTEESGGKSANAVQSNGERKINKAKLGDRIWIQNNVPYARVIEDGLFPHDTPEGGSKATHIPKSRRAKSGVVGETLVRGGFHVSAPNGMLADAVQQAQAEYGGLLQ
jgi:hypothetical protein